MNHHARQLLVKACGYIHATAARLEHRFGQRHTIQPSWHLTVWRAGPIIGVLALVGAVGCVFASFAILRRSHLKPVTGTDFAPQQVAVQLSATTAVCNTLISFALVQAVPILWWRHALQGKTIADLELEWESSHNLLHAMMHPRSSLLITCASFAVTILAVDGPLLQKASKIRPLPPSSLSTFTMNIANELPAEWAGIVSTKTFQVSPALKDIVKKYQMGQSAFPEFSGCEARENPCTGTLNFKVNAPGLWKYDCGSVDVPVEYGNISTWPSNANRSEFVLFTAFVDHAYSDPRFWFPSLSDWASNAPWPTRLPEADPDRESIAVWSAHTNLLQGAGDIIMEQCWMVPAILQYEVRVTFGDHRTANDFQLLRSTPELVALTNNTASLRDVWSTYQMTNQTRSVPATIVPIAAYVGTTLHSSVSFRHEDAEHPVLNENDGGLISAWAIGQTQGIGSRWNYTSISPLNEMITELNAALFHTAVYAARHFREAGIHGLVDGPCGAENRSCGFSQTVNATRLDEVSTYVTHYRWWAAATIIQLAAIFSTLPIFWGWWTLGRDVSFSPTEMAKAFEAPLLRDVHSNAGKEGNVRQAGQTYVRYGVVRESLILNTEKGNEEWIIGRDRLAFEQYSKVERPKAGEQIQY